jgi:hypothetical protein
MCDMSKDPTVRSLYIVKKNLMAIIMTYLILVFVCSFYNSYPNHLNETHVVKHVHEKRNISTYFINTRDYAS